MSAWHGRVELDRHRATPGRCLACDRPALRDAVGWSHVGNADEVACILNSTRAAEYRAYEAPPLRFTVATLAAAALISLGAGILSVVWCGLSTSGAVLVGVILYGPTAGAVAAGAQWARNH